MLTLYHSRAGRGERPANLAEESPAENVAWIDLLRPQPDEVAFVKRTTGLDVPSIADLSEIESSSRLRNQNGAIYLSARLVYRADSDQPLTTPVGFVLTRERLITVRFEELNSFTTFANRDLAAESDPLSSAAVFAGLMDAIADHLADILENIAAELEANPQSAELSHAEWLALLLDREATERYQRRLRARLRYARLRHQAAVEDVDYRAARGLDRSLFQALIAGRWIEEAQNLIIEGPAGGRQELARLCARSESVSRQPLGALPAHPRMFADLALGPR